MMSRAASGARLVGDDVQHLIVWYHVLRTQRADSSVAELAVESADAGNVDDLTLCRTGECDEYWQVKASVDATSPLTEEWLLRSLKGGPSLLQRLYASWLALRPRHERPPKVVLATTKAIDPTDIVLGPRATMDARVVETLRCGSGALAEARKRWAGHLHVKEDELIRFLECLEIRHGQSEAEWREKVQDAAAAVRVRADSEAVIVGTQQVRDWVKAPRRAFTPKQISVAIDKLNLRIKIARPLLVFQALEHNPRAQAAAYSVDWTDLFQGTDPRNRRVFLSPSAARARISADLALARRQLRAVGIYSFEVDGPMRLPLWFAVGAAFCSTAGFNVSAQARDGIWSSSPDLIPKGDLEVHVSLGVDAISKGRPWVVSVSLATDISDDVDEFLAKEIPEACHIQARLPEPGRSALSGLPHARAVIFQLRDELRALRRCLHPPELHLFMAMPGACALLLGNAWDRMPPTWTYWDLGTPGQYAPALLVDN